MIKTSKMEEKSQDMDTKGPNTIPKAATNTAQPQWIRKEKVYLAAASHQRSATLTAMRTAALKNKGLLLIHVDYMLGEPITEVLEQILKLRDKKDKSHFKAIVFLDKPGELDLFNSIRDIVRMLATHCRKHHPSTSNHG